MNNLSILYVEDDPIVLENFTEILGHYFTQIWTAKDGEEAYRLYEKHQPNIVLLDISLPKMSGLDVAAKIRIHDTTTELIIMTAYSDQEKLLHAVNLQLHAYMVKPVQASQLDSTLKSLFEKLDTQNNFLKLSDNFVWDREKKELFYKQEKVKISKNETHILTLLSLHVSQYYKACEIAEEIFTLSQEKDSQCNNVVQVISRFKRKMLTQYPNEEFFILNTYSAGYKININ